MMELKLLLVLMLHWNLHITCSELCKEKNICTLTCGSRTADTMTWAKVINGGRTDILTNQNGKVTMHSKKFKRYSSKKNFLIINKVLRSDAGRFYCNENAVDLGVVTGIIPAPCPTIPTEHGTAENTQSKAERVLMLVGVGLAALVFLLASVAAGRVLTYRAWQAGRDSVLNNSH